MIPHKTGTNRALPGTTRDVLQSYVRFHNNGILHGDFGPMLDLFAEHAEMHFTMGELRPLIGRDAIREAFQSHRPVDEIVILRIEVEESRAMIAYACGARPSDEAGSIMAEIYAGTIVKLVVHTN